jgi:hypothetical protein
MLCVTTHLLTSEMIIFIDTNMLLCLWRVIQFFNPVSRLGNFAICVHYSSPFYSYQFRNDHFYRNRHSVVSVACYAVLQPCSRLGHSAICVHYSSPTFVILLPHSHTMFSVTDGHNNFQLSYYHALSHTLPPLIRNKQ